MQQPQYQPAPKLPSLEELPVPEPRRGAAGAAVVVARPAGVSAPQSPRQVFAARFGRRSAPGPDHKVSEHAADRRSRCAGPLLPSVGRGAFDRACRSSITRTPQHHRTTASIDTSRGEEGRQRAALLLFERHHPLRGHRSAAFPLPTNIHQTGPTTTSATASAKRFVFASRPSDVSRARFSQWQDVRLSHCWQKGRIEQLLVTRLDARSRVTMMAPGRRGQEVPSLGTAGMSSRHKPYILALLGSDFSS